MDDKRQAQPPEPSPRPEEPPERLSEAELMESGDNLDEGQIEGDGPAPK